MRLNIKGQILNTIIIFAIIIISIILICLCSPRNSSNQTQNSAQTSKPYLTQIVTIKNKDFSVQIADTNVKKTLGLSNKNKLKNNKGMLFTYDQPGLYSFWMKDMNFSIDIIWISKDKKIINISKDISPATYPKTFKPPRPAQYILEINAGLSDKYGFKIGNKVNFQDIN